MAETKAKSCLTSFHPSSFPCSEPLLSCITYEYLLYLIQDSNTWIAPQRLRFFTVHECMHCHTVTLRFFNGCIIFLKDARKGDSRQHMNVRLVLGKGNSLALNRANPCFLWESGLCQKSSPPNRDSGAIPILHYLFMSISLHHWCKH